jgi:2-phosphosulfolactate phosphatase
VAVRRRIRVFGSYRNLGPTAVEGVDAVIVDVLRATTTIAFAVSRGAHVLALADEQDARERGAQLGDRAILVGERMGQRLAGFHCNNSPTELGALQLADKVVVITTTNGTQAVAASARAHRIFTGALTNAPALARYLCRSGELERDVAIICAGRSTGALAMEDLLGAGAIASAILDAVGPDADLWVADGARVALELFRREQPRLIDAVRDSDAAEELIDHGAAADVGVAAMLGAVSAVPCLRDGMFVAAPELLD